MGQGVRGKLQVCHRCWLWRGNKSRTCPDALGEEDSLRPSWPIHQGFGNGELHSAVLNDKHINQEPR